MIRPATQKIGRRINAVPSLIPADDEGVSDSSFWHGWLGALTVANEAHGGVLRLRANSGTWRTAATIRFPELPLGTEDSAERHGQLVFEAFVVGRPKIIPPRQGLPDSEANPTANLLVIAPVTVGDNFSGVVELLLPADLSPDRQSEVLTKIADAAAKAEQGGERQVNPAREVREAVVHAVQQFCAAIHRSLSTAKTAAAIANEGKRLLGCERLSVVVRRGRHYEVRAVSGLDEIERRSAASKALATMAAAVSAGLEAVHYPPLRTDDDHAENLPPQVRARLSEYVDQSFARRVSVIPLLAPATRAATDTVSAPTELLGALVVEWFTENVTAAGYEERCRFAAEHAALALTNALAHESVPGIRILARFARPRSSSQPFWKRRATWFAAAALVTIAALTFVPADFTIHAPATLQPAHNQFAFAPGDGVVRNVFVRHGDRVTAGQPLLELRNVELEVTLADLAGRRRAAQEQLAAVERSLYEDSTRLAVAERHRLSGERSRLRQDVSSYAKQLELT